MKVIIYATGRVFETYKEKIDWKSVVAIADKYPQYDEMYGVPVIHPDDIGNIEYDFIAIFSYQLFEKIKMELVGEYFIPCEKIISWKGVIREEGGTAYDLSFFYKSFLREKKCEKVLDVGMNILPKSFLYKTEILEGKDGILDGIIGEETIFNENLYDNVFESLDDNNKNYDCVLLWKESHCTDTILRMLGWRTKYILLYVSYKLEFFVRICELRRELQKYGKVKYISRVEGIFFIIEPERKNVIEDINIYVVTHKKYNIQSNQLYKPLCVGKYKKEGYLTELAGENIAYLNKKINECTALYWIWKNTNTKYVGLNHYRRFFYNNEVESMDNYLEINHVSDLLREYDIILPRVYSTNYFTVYEQLSNTIDRELCQRVYICFFNELKKKQPYYIEALESVMKGNKIYICNMFVTNREILNRYCEWLFSFLIDVAEKIDVEGYDSYSQRVLGFFAERMWTVWLRKNKLKIKELPYVIPN